MFLKLAKASYIVFIFYIVWFQAVFFQVNNAPLILGLIMIILLIFYKLSIREKISILITKPIFWWLIFSFYIFFSGYIVAENKILLIKSVVTYIENLVMMIFIIEISKYEKSNQFFLKSYTILSIIYMINLIFMGVNKNGVITISATSNPNGDGLIMLFGIFCILMILDMNKPLNFITSYISIGMLLYGIILTSSRKSFLSAIFLILMWLIFNFTNNFKLASFKQKIFVSFVIIGTLCLFIFYFLPSILNSHVYARLTTGFGYEGDQIRINMYSTAVGYFKSHIFFGIGFNQFRELSPWNTYSHSTYAEIISCTGVIGTILYFIPYLIIIYNLILIYKDKKQPTIHNQAILYLILMILMLILATGVINFYDITCSMMFALMISFYYIQGDKRNQSKCIYKKTYYK